MNKKVVYSLLALIVLAAGAATGVVLVQQNQSVEPRATVPDGIGTMELNPATQLNLGVGDTFSVDVIFDSSGLAVGGATAQIEYQYDPSLSQPPIAVTAVRPNPTLSQDNQWNYAASDFSSEGGTTTIRIIAADTSIGGYTASGQTTFATIDFIVRQEGTIALSFDLTESQLIGKAAGADILAPPANPAGTYSAGATATNSPTPSPTSPPDTDSTPTPSPVVTDSPFTTATPNPTASPTQAATNNTQTTTSVAITSIANGAQLTDTTPTISGTAPAGSTVSLSLTGATSLSGSATTNSSGNWTWTTPSILSGGKYSITATANGASDSVSFSITTTTGSTTLPESGNIHATLLIVMIGIILLGGGVILTTH